MPQARKPEELRSARWFAPDDLRAFGHRSRAMQMGYAPEDWVGKPVIAILNTWSRRSTLPHALQAARRGREARRPAGRRLPDGAAGAVAVGELRQADHHALPQPAGDGGRGAAARPSGRRRRADGRLRQDHARRCCMGAISAGLPAIYLPAGPMLRGNWKGKVLGSRLRRLEILGRAPRRQDHRRRTGSTSRPASRAATAPA